MLRPRRGFFRTAAAAALGADRETGHGYDDTTRYVGATALSDANRVWIYAGDVRQVFPGLAAKLSGWKHG